MASVTALQAGYLGIQRGLADATAAAERIAQPDAAAGLESLTEATVALLAAEQQVQASAAVVDTTQDAIGSLIDTFA
jgi:hypothetical protein